MSEESTIAAPRKNSRAHKRRAERQPYRKPGQSIGRVVVWGYACIALAPLILVLVNSFRPTADFVSNPVGFPTHLYLDNYKVALSQGNFFAIISNSLLYAGVGAIVATFISVLAAYALARWNVRGGSVIVIIFLSGLMIPIQYSALPLFQEFSKFGLVDSRIGIILFYAASGVPFSTYVLLPFCRQLPKDLEDAAMLDGASLGSAFFRVMLPLLRPGIVAVAMFNFMPLWNQFFYPLILLRSPDKFPISVGLTSFFGEHSVDFGPLFAALVVSAVPLVAIFMIGVRKIVDGLATGGVK
ncbi:MAG: carbohydrate ABC transporter permease [Nakamurella sp.]